MKPRKRKNHSFLFLLSLILAACCLFQLPQVNLLLGRYRVEKLGLVEIPEWVDQQIINVDGTSRRGEKLEDIQNIVIHYVGNPGTSARANRNWYANPESEVSSHFLVGLGGEVIQCIPLDEFSSASNHRNNDTISIEVCHPDDTGKFNDPAYASLVKLTAWLLKSCSLTPEDIIRHYDVTGKECPRYFVRNEEAWLAFREDVALAWKEEQ